MLGAGKMSEDVGMVICKAVWCFFGLPSLLVFSFSFTSGLNMLLIEGSISKC